MTVEKTLGVKPKRIEALDVTVRLVTDVSPDVRTRLERAARHCVVHRSLSEEVVVSIGFVVG